MNECITHMERSSQTVLFIWCTHQSNPIKSNFINRTFTIWAFKANATWVCVAVCESDGHSLFFSLSCYLSCACRKRSLSQSVCLSQMCNHIASSARHFILISHALFRNKFIPIYYRLRTHCMHRIYLVWF